MYLKMGFDRGRDLYFDFWDDITSGNNEISFKLDDRPKQKLFDVYKDTAGKVTYSDIADDYDSYLTINQVGGTNGELREFGLAVKKKDPYHLTKKEYEFYSKPHDFILYVEKKEFKYTDLYIQPGDYWGGFFHFSNVKTEDGYTTATIDDIGFDLGEEGTNGKTNFSDNTYEIVSKTATGNKGWDYKIKFQRMTRVTDLPYAALYFEFEPYESERKNGYWQATYKGGKAKPWVQLWGLGAPRLYIKNGKNVYRVVKKKINDNDGELYEKKGNESDAIYQNAKAYIKTDDSILEIDLKAYENMNLATLEVLDYENEVQ